MQAEHTRTLYEELSSIDRKSAADKYRGASIIMENYGDQEMADTLRLLSGQMDFDDSTEADDAIKRTMDKLDGLIADRDSHNAFSYISRLTDDMVIARSNGKVTETDVSVIHSRYLKDGLYDPDIFGGSGSIPVVEGDTASLSFHGSFGRGFGHIELPVPVVLESDYHIISMLLSMSAEDIEAVAKYQKYAVVASDNTDFPVGSVVTEAEHRDCHDNSVKFAIGGDAIYKLLENLHYADHPERLAFRMVLVAAPGIRPLAFNKTQKRYMIDKLTCVYTDIIANAHRMEHMISMGVPSIIVYNYGHILDDQVNKLDKFVKSRLGKYAGRKCQNPYMKHVFEQLWLVSRRNTLDYDTQPVEKISDIESLNIYPETIRVKKGRVCEDISLEEVIKHNDDVLADYQGEHAVEIPAGVDPDNLPEEIQDKIAESDAKFEELDSITEAIYVGAESEREAFTVELDAETCMYKPC